MSNFTSGKWICKIERGAAFIDAEDKQRRLASINSYNVPEWEANAQLMAHAKEMYERLQDVMNTINGVLPYVPDGIDDLHLQYDKNSLQVEADLIDDLLTLIDGEEAQS